MKPLRLGFQAFGPYPKHAVIDFSAVANGGLFLIHGQTGAGKTSILDGICFALFGTSSGSDRTAEGLRSDLAQPDTPTEVSFDFTLGSRCFRSVRRPKQFLKRQRGDGLALQQPKAELWQLCAPQGAHEIPAVALAATPAPLAHESVHEDGRTWQLECSGVEKCDVRIAQLLGMNEVQFRQVVILPQGQFRKFLSASSLEREQLLEALFRTGKYRQLADVLNQKAVALETKIRSRQETRKALFAAAGENLNSLEEIDERLQKNQQLERERQAQVKELDLQLAGSLERLRRAEKFRDLQSESLAIDQRQAQLDQQQSEMQSIAKRLQETRLAAPVCALDLSIRQTEQDLARLELRRRQETEQLKRSESALAEGLRAKDKLEKQAPEIEALKSESQRLRELYLPAKRLKIESEAFSSALKSLDAAALRTAELEVDQRQQQHLLIELTTQSTDLQELAGQRQSCEFELRRYTSQLAQITADLKDFDQQELELARKKSDYARLHTELVAARSELTRLRVNFHLAQAALLALELKDGLPCPVCGSCEHPLPNPSAAPLVSQDAIEIAQAAQDRLVSQTSGLEGQIISLQSEAERSLGKLRTHLPAGESAEIHVRTAIDRWLSELRGSLDELKSQSLVIAAADEKLGKIRKRESELKSTMERTSHDLSSQVLKREELRVQVAGAQARVSELEQQVPENFRDLSALTVRGQALTKIMDSFVRESLENSQKVERESQSVAASQANLQLLESENHQRAHDLLGRREEQNQLLTASGFKTLEDCRQAALSPAEVLRLERGKQLYDNECAVVSARKQELTQALNEMPEWARNLSEREHEYRLIDQQSREAHAQILGFKEMATALGIARERISLLNQELGADEELYRVTGRLSGIASGQPPHNLSRINFARFVLASRLDEVLELASRRLFAMSRGQFSLKRARVQDDKRRNTGLDLEVDDAQTASSRPTSSLSGGEGFLASLCLALGLSDVVQNELGGVRIDAVFIDEGFGTLDSETLEFAMKTLTELQAGGRVVGIISHVPELRAQIARRLYVKKTPSGSVVYWENSHQSEAL